MAFIGKPPFFPARGLHVPVAPVGVRVRCGQPEILTASLLPFRDRTRYASIPMRKKGRFFTDACPQSQQLLSR